MLSITVGVSAVPTGSVLIVVVAAAGSGKGTDGEHERKAPEVIVMHRPSNRKRSVCKRDEGFENSTKRVECGITRCLPAQRTTLADTQGTPVVGCADRS
jgi:hypothetical protein